MKTTLLVMTLNELDGMKAIMPRVQREWCDQILVVDGGSTDGTVEWARANGFEVYSQKQRGFRHAYVESLPVVRGDVMITFSPDGNSVPEVIPQLVAKMREGYDMVIASRYFGDAKSEDDDLVTAFGNWLFTKTVNVLHGGNYTDVMVIFRAYRKQLVYDLELHSEEPYRLVERLFGTKISWEPLLSVRAAKRRLKVAEIPGDEPARIGGVRKLQILRWGAAYYFQFWRELFMWR
jgi:glycosyltransferase involved in cell wall biosynthesis